MFLLKGTGSEIHHPANLQVQMSNANLVLSLAFQTFTFPSNKMLLFENLLDQDDNLP